MISLFIGPLTRDRTFFHFTLQHFLRWKLKTPPCREGWDTAAVAQALAPYMAMQCALYSLL